MSISPTVNQVSASSSSFIEPETQSSSLDNGYSFRPSSNGPLGDIGVSDSPPPPLSGEMVSATVYSGEASKEIKNRNRSQCRNSSLPHSDDILHRKDVVHLMSRSSEQQEKARGSFISPRGHQLGAYSTGHPGPGHAVGRKSRMVSGNNLLNFQYEPISVSRPQPRVPPRRQKARKPYNKDLFFQANYKFVILDTGNYAVESLDPDNMLSWEDIICLKYSTPVPLLCPICLDHPLCPQITSCGHIFCFPCILQYFFIDKDTTKEECWKKCPLCFTMISSKDLYIVQLEMVKHYHVGDEIEFVLLTRPKGSFSSSVRNCETINVEDEMINSFTKFFLTSDTDLSMREAMADLDSWIAKVHSGLTDDIERLPYVCAAVEQLEKRKIYWDKRCSLNAADESEISLSPPLASHADANLSSSLNAKSISLEKFSQDKEVRKFPSPAAEGSTHFSEIQDKSLSSSYEGNKGFWPNSFDINEKMSYNFYQAIDGQNIVLHPFNMKCLLHHFGSPDQLPDRITGNILDLETVTQSEVMRRRFRFLSHLPLTTTFQLCEVNLGDVLPAEALSPFMGEIKDREKQRKRLARKEMKEKIKAEAASSQFCLEPHYSYDATPSFSMDDFEALGSSVDVPQRPPAMLGQCQSFSAVARLGFAAACDSPALKNEESQTSAKSNASRDSTVPGSSNKGAAASASSFASIISSRAQRDQVVAVPKTNEAGKKGKKTTQILLSTAGGRRY